jgi:hypothetical protein
MRMQATKKVMSARYGIVGTEKPAVPMGIYATKGATSGLPH